MRKNEQQYGMIKFLPPAKKQNQIEQVSDSDDFTKAILRRKMFKMYNSGIYPMVGKQVKDME